MWIPIERTTKPRVQVHQLVMCNEDHWLQGKEFLTLYQALEGHL